MKKSKKNSETQMEKEVEKAVHMIDEMDMKEIQKEYRKNVPVFIWFLKILIVINILGMFLQLYINYAFMEKFTVTTLSIIIILNTLFIYGIIIRKRWAFYLGIIFYILNIVNAYVMKSPLDLILSILVIIIFSMHKDYLNK